MPIAEGVKRNLVVGFGDDHHIVGLIPYQEDNVHGFVSECALEIDHFRGRSYRGDNCFRDKTERHNLHAYFDLLH